MSSTIRKNRILNSAFDLFAEKGIDTIAMTDIAKKAEIGVASLYRYYETKEEIAIRTSIWAWEKQKLLIETILYKDNFDNLNGYNQLEKICSMFEYLYKNETPFLRYIYFFDSDDMLASPNALNELNVYFDKYKVGYAHKGLVYEKDKNCVKSQQIKDDESFIIGLLEELPMAPDDILHTAMEHDTAWTARRLSSLLMVMEVKRLIRRRADARYEAL